MSQLIPNSPTLPDLSPTSVRKTHFLLANKRPILSFGGALLIGYLLTPLVFKSQQGDELASQSQPAASVLIPASSVMTVRSSPASSIPITGEVKLVANVTGKAPVSGAVARWLVEPGQKVEKGQGVVEISSGEAVRPPTKAEASQNRAEKMQIDAANDQLELARKLALATSQLRIARERVASAQETVSEARSLIKRLQNGESVVEPARIRTRIVRRQVAPAASPEVAASPEEVKAQAALKSAQKTLDSAQALQKGADTEVKNIERSIAAGKSAVRDAEKRIALTEAAFEQGKVSGADVYESRAALEDANAAVKTAEAKIDGAKREADAQQKKTAAALAQLDDARKALAMAKSQSKTRVAAVSTPQTVEEVVEEVAPSLDANSEPSAMSISDASRMAQEALAESQAASREADRLTSQVAMYRSQAHASNTEITEASEELMQAQQQVLNAVPRPRFTVCEAPNSGTIVWISRMASEVGAGDNVFGVASTNRFTALMKVDSPAWKTIKIGQIVSGSLGKPRPTLASPMLVPNIRGTTYSPVASKEVSLNIEVTKVTPPADGSPALVEGDIDVLTGTTSLLDAGKILAASLPTSQKSGGIRVPDGAVLKKAGRYFVATLTPQIQPAATEAEVKSASPSATDDEATAPNDPSQDLSQPQGETYLLQWKPVEVGAEIDGEREIRGGVQMGTRIVSDILSLLPQIDLDPQSTSSVTVTDI